MEPASGDARARPRHAGRSVGRGLGRSFGQRRFKRGDSRLKRLVFFARKPCHILNGLEILALDHIQLAQNTLCLGAKQRLEFPAHTLGDAGGIVHKPRHLIKKPVCGLYHDCLNSAAARPLAMRNDNGDGAAPSQEVCKGDDRTVMKAI